MAVGREDDAHVLYQVCDGMADALDTQDLYTDFSCTGTFSGTDLKPLLATLRRALKKEAVHEVCCGLRVWDCV